VADRSRTKKLVSAAILAVVLCLGLLGWWHWYWRTLGFFARDAAIAKVQSIQNLVNHNIKPGDSPETVYQFLDGQRIGYSRLDKNMAFLAGHDYRYENTVMATERDIAGSSLVTESLQIIFVFDDQRKLARIDFVPQFTGP
jgi:hypothetical protein